MSEAQFEFWRRWLVWANVMIVGVGLAVAFAGDSILFEMHNEATRSVFFNGQDFAPEVLRLKRWLFGIIGGTIVGFHVLMIFIALYPFRGRAPWSYNALWAGLLSWFVVDSGVSAYYGAMHNILLINLVALVMIGLPLVMTYRAFRR